MLPQRTRNIAVQLEFCRTFGKIAGHMFRKTSRAQGNSLVYYAKNTPCKTIVRQL